MKTNIDEIVSLIAEVAAYSLSHLDKGDSQAYQSGVKDSTAHMISCCLVQWIPHIFGDGVGASDVLCTLNGAINRESIYQALVKFTMQEIEDQ